MLTYPYLKNHNVVIRRPEDKDADQFRFLFDRPMRKEQALQMIHLFEGAYVQKKEMILTIADEDDNAVGALEIYHLDLREAELGYRILSEKRHQGYASEAVHAFLAWAEGCQDFTAHTDQQNLWSQKVLLKNGFCKIKEENDICTFRYHHGGSK